jgi:outer membrane protein OmpA-like peptidoglycan-associated protein
MPRIKAISAMKKSLLAAGIVLLASTIGIAQEYPKAELALDYSYLHFAPAQAFTNNHSLNGGGGAFVYNFANHFGIKMDLQGYNSFTNTFAIPASPSLPSGANGSVSGNLFTYMFGPQLKFRGEHVQLLLDALGGAAHSNVYGNAFKTLCQPIAGGCSGASASPSNNGAAMMFGGGLDFPINHRVSVRAAELDYVLTRFGNFFTQSNANQNSFRYLGGLNFNFGLPNPAVPTASCVGHDLEALPDDPPLTVGVQTTDFNPKHPLTYQWESTGGKVVGDGSSAKVDVTGAEPGSYQVTSRVTDPKQKKNNVASCNLAFTVKQPKAPVVSCSASPSSIVAGASTPITINVQGSTPDGRPIQSRKFSASAGSVQEGQTSAGASPGEWASIATLDTNGVQPGKIDVNVGVTDSRGLSSSCLASVAVEAPPAPPAPVVSQSQVGQCDFSNGKKPARVDNACKAALDDTAMKLKQEPDAKLVIVGFADSDEAAKSPQLSGLRALNAKTYLTGGEGGQGIDASRVEIRSGQGEGKNAVLYFVPAGASFSAENTAAVDEAQIKEAAATVAKKGKKQGATAAAIR